MNIKIYVVLRSEELSDSVVKIFTTEEAARQFAVERNRKANEYYHYVEEHELVGEIPHSIAA